jgi:NADH:ubiquinone oxidoreductase subunit
MAKKVKRVRKEWTKEDVRALKAHSKARTPVAKIAKQMKRTEGTLRQKAWALEIGLGHQR